MEHGNTYSSETSNESFGDSINEWGSLTNNGDEAYYATNALKKARRRERRKATRRHNKPKVQYRNEKAQREAVRTQKFNTEKDRRDKESLGHTIEAQLESWDAYEAEDLDDLGRTFNYDANPDKIQSPNVNAKAIIENHRELFDFLGEATSYDPDIESKYEAIADKKERLDFIVNTSLANRVRLFCGDNFGCPSYESLYDQLDFQQDLMRGEAVVEDEWGNKYCPNPETVMSDDVRLGLARGTAKAAMLGTPEYGAYQTALNIAKKKKIFVPDFFPKIKGTESGVQYYRRSNQLGQWSQYIDIGSWSMIIDEYEKISNRVAKDNPVLDDDSLEHQTVMKAANIYVDAMSFGPFTSFSSAIACSQLGERAKKRLIKLSKVAPINISNNISRFIGKSGVSWRERGLELGMKRVSKELEELELASDDNKDEILSSKNTLAIEKATKWRNQELERINQKYDKEISRTRNIKRHELYNDRRESEINAVLNQFTDKANYFKNRNFNELVSDTENELADIKNRYEKSKSLAEKAIDLQVMGHRKYSHDGIAAFYHHDGSIVVPTSFLDVDWINNAPLGTIKKAHQRLRDGMSMAEIELLAKEDCIRRINPSLSQAEINILLFGSGSLNAVELSTFAKLLEDESLPNDYQSNTEYYDIMPGWRFLVKGDYAKAREDYFEDLLYREDSVDDYEEEDEDEEEEGIFDWLINYYDQSGEINYLLTYEMLLKKSGITAHELVDKMQKIQDCPWLLHSLSDDRVDVLSFPFEAYDNAKATWCAKNGFFKLGSEYGIKTIGNVILTRLNAGIDNSLHDATMWLNYFDTPETTYDTKRIKQDIANGVEIESLNDYTIRLKNEDLERELLTQIVCTNKEDRKKLRLTNKPQKISKMFSAPINAYIYQKVLDYTKSESEWQQFARGASGESASYYDEHLANNAMISRDNFIIGVESTIRQISFNERANDTANKPEEVHSKKALREISLMTQELNNLGERRKEFANEATAWITNYKMAPHDILTSTWRDRAVALKLGADDTLKSIGDVMSKCTFLESVKGSPMLQESTLTEEDLSGRYEPFVIELTRQRGRKRTYSADTIILGIDDYNRLHNPEKICPAAEYKLEHKHGSYVGTVLAHDDPRGMTIGLDTGCCMTVGGYSYSCIESGYRDENAGFFALYESDGQIVAQSYFYTNPDEPEVLVMDNIEANRGRSANTIVDLYGDFFKQYLKERFREDPEWKIREVHIGTQFGELVKPIVSRLAQTLVVLNPDRSIYSDAAYDQRLLFRLSDEEINEARRVDSETIDSQAKLNPTHRTRINMSPLTNSHAELIQDLEARLYPTEMRQYDDESFLDNELSMPGAKNYSFIMNNQTDATEESIGYCIAYEADSETDPTSDKKCIYVADFGILSDYRYGIRTALNGLDELLHRVKEGGYDKIEMEARSSTSYRLLTSPVGQRLLNARGYKLSDYGLSESFGDEEQTYLISLETA